MDLADVGILGDPCARLVDGDSDGVSALVAHQVEPAAVPLRWAVIGNADAAVEA